MTFSNKYFHDFASKNASYDDPCFALIVSFDFYDGLERGVALYSSGESIRYSSLGDSLSRRFRAFEFATIEGDFWSTVNALSRATDDASPTRILLTNDSEALTRLDCNVFDAPALDFYVGVGSPYLDRLIVTSCFEDQLNTVRQLGGGAAGFLAAHQILKNRRKIN